jgi:hypothetical protein
MQEKRPLLFKDLAAGDSCMSTAVNHNLQARPINPW